ncbi:MAG: hypothetical protein EZS28_022435 [Streblomastix strix]|uniref:Uncharacterized protein n=1 Tax=Streblomastix strix TaxID=222440 RepID=A0A5J4VI73_9EUKA|nr:MAG: hypothetical protein EZS28_022435 [Streblomastix strix]
MNRIHCSYLAQTRKINKIIQTWPQHSSSNLQTRESPHHKIKSSKTAQLLQLRSWNSTIARKRANSIPQGKKQRNAKKQRQEEMEDDCWSLEINKRSSKEKGGALDPKFETEQCRLAVSAQRASTSALHAMALVDYKSATMWTHHIPHIARIIAREYKTRRENALASEQFKGILRAEISALDVFGDESKKNIKYIAKTQKILADQEKQIPQAAPTTPIVQSITQTPLQQQQFPSSAQVQTPIFQQPYFKQFPQQQFSSSYQLPSNLFVSFNPSQYGFFLYGRTQKHNKRGGFQNWNSQQQQQQQQNQYTSQQHSQPLPIQN